MHEIAAGTRVEMVGIAQSKRGVDLLEMFRCEGLDRRMRAIGREIRGEVSAWGGEYPCSGAVVFGGDLVYEHRLVMTVKPLQTDI